MKSDELMLGNWVMRNLFNGGKDPVQVTQLEMGSNWIHFMDRSFDKEYGSYKCMKEDECEPIPLSNDILKKNGFEVQHGAYLTSRWYDKKYKISIMRHASSTDTLMHYCIYLKEDDEYSQLSYVPDFVCEYVHELQNFFKLKKIDKKIELW